MKNQRIRTKVDTRFTSTPQPIELGGWLSGKHSYLWIGEPDPEQKDSKGRCFALLSGQKLYRLAKAIVDRYEAE